MEEIAAVYARSLFEAALDAGRQLDVVRDQLGEFADALDADRELQVFFFSPYFSTQEKKDGLHTRGRRGGADLPQLPRAAAGEPPHAGDLPHPARVRRASGRTTTSSCRSRSPRRSSSTRAPCSSIGDRIAEQTGRKVELSSTVEPDILGGIVVRVGNQVLDASIRNRLDTLRKQVVRA